MGLFFSPPSPPSSKGAHPTRNGAGGYIYIYLSIYTHTHTCMYRCMYIYIYIYMYIYVYIYIYMYVCIYIYMYRYTHTHTHTYIYIYRWGSVLLPLSPPSSKDVGNIYRYLSKYLFISIYVYTYLLPLSPPSSKGEHPASPPLVATSRAPPINRTIGGGGVISKKIQGGVTLPLP